MRKRARPIDLSPQFLRSIQKKNVMQHVLRRKGHYFDDDGLLHVSKGFESSRKLREKEKAQTAMENNERTDSDAMAFPKGFLRNVLNRAEQITDIVDAISDITDAWNMPNRKKNPLGYATAAAKTVSSLSRMALNYLGENVNGVYDRWIKDNGYVDIKMPYPALSILQKILQDVPCTVETVVNGDEIAKSLKFDLGTGASLGFLTHKDAGSLASLRLKDLVCLRQCCKPEHVELVSKWIRERVWTCFGGSGIELLINSDDDSDHYTCTIASVSAILADLPSFGVVDEIVARTKKFMTAGISRKIMLHGPPGTGKTTLARYVGNALDGRTMVIGNAITDHNDSYTVMRVAQEWIAFLEPSVLVIDDFDRVENPARFLNFVDKLENGDKPLVLFMTANSLSRTFIDPAMLRPGRTDEIHEVQAPDADGIRKLVDFFCKQYGVETLSNADLEKIMLELPESSPADLKNFIELMAALGKEDTLSELHRLAAQKKLYSKSRDPKEDLVAKMPYESLD